MSATTLVQAKVPNDIQQTANEIIQAAGLTVGEIVQRLMQRIADHHAVPQYLLSPDQGDAQASDRTHAIEELKVLRKRLRTAPTTLDEIMAWRDEGRR